jgi:hypothetical protein
MLSFVRGAGKFIIDAYSRWGFTRLVFNDSRTERMIFWEPNVNYSNADEKEFGNVDSL